MAQAWQAQISTSRMAVRIDRTDEDVPAKVLRYATQPSCAIILHSAHTHTSHALIYQFFPHRPAPALVRTPTAPKSFSLDHAGAAAVLGGQGPTTVQCMPIKERICEPPPHSNLGMNTGPHTCLVTVSLNRLSYCLNLKTKVTSH